MFMDRKEGAVDNQTISEYNKGWRAYINYDGKMIFQDTRDGFISGSEDIDVDKWHALRAYQDAKRKKGLPIEINAKSANSWLTLSYGHFLSGNILRAATPGIDVFNQNGIIIGRFTNFRWRAGYFSTKVGEKGGQNG